MSQTAVLPPGPPGQGATGKSLILALMATVQLMVVIDVSIVNIALPTVHRALGFTTESLHWVVNAYTLSPRLSTAGAARWFSAVSWRPSYC